MICKSYLISFWLQVFRGIRDAGSGYFNRSRSWSWDASPGREKALEPYKISPNPRIWSRAGAGADSFSSESELEPAPECFLNSWNISLESGPQPEPYPAPDPCKIRFRALGRWTSSYIFYVHIRFRFSKMKPPYNRITYLGGVGRYERY